MKNCTGAHIVKKSRLSSIAQEIVNDIERDLFTRPDQNVISPSALFQTFIKVDKNRNVSYQAVQDLIVNVVQSTRIR